MAATAAALLPSREDTRAQFRIARVDAQRQRQMQARRTSALGNQPVLYNSLGATPNIPSAANNDAVFRAARHSEQIKRQIGSPANLFPAGVQESIEDDIEQEPNEPNYLAAYRRISSEAQAGLTGRATSAIRGELDNLKQKAMAQANEAFRKKAQEIFKRWTISLTKNTSWVVENIPWAAYIIQAGAFIYDNARAVVTIFIPNEVQFDVRSAVSTGSKKLIRFFIPPFSLTEPVGILGFIGQSLFVGLIIVMITFWFVLLITIVLAPSIALNKLTP